MAKDNIYFVPVREPSIMRRKILETSKDLINSLKQYERFKHVREEKIKTILELRHIFAEINELNTRLKSKLPNAQLKFTKITNKRKKKRVKKDTREHVSMSSKQLDKLEEELSKVEEQLNELHIS